jgi:cytoskeletal protein CcmA (bactofilin family)
MENTTANPPEESDELESTASESSPAPAPAPKDSGKKKATSGASAQAGSSNAVKSLIFNNKYLFVFILLIIGAGGAVMYALNAAKNSTQPTVKTQSLTSKEIATLKGNTTFVGDPQQTLSVQSSSVFEGAVLLKNNLEVAGSLKVSSPLSLSGLTVSGSTTLGQTAVNALSVSGNATLQSDVNISKNLIVAGASSFGGPVTAGQISVTNLLLGGDLAIPRHITTRAGIPAKQCGPAIGDGSCSVNGSDTAGTVNLNTGNSAGTGILATVTFSAAYAGNPHVVITPIGVNGADLHYYITNRTSTGFSIATTTAPPNNANFAFDYIIVD